MVNRTHDPESQVLKADTSTTDRLNVADVLGFRKEWSTLKSDNKAAIKSPPDNGDHIIYMSCLSLTSYAVLHLFLSQWHQFCRNAQWAIETVSLASLVN
jgi:hypothetical protein